MKVIKEVRYTDQTINESKKGGEAFRSNNE
jgi:hypothetical protein